MVRLPNYGNHLSIDDGDVDDDDDDDAPLSSLKKLYGPLLSLQQEDK